MKKIIMLFMAAAFLFVSCQDADRLPENSYAPSSSEVSSENIGDTSNETESADVITKEDLSISYSMLGHWMRGKGEKMIFKEADLISVAMKNSPKIKALAEDAVKDYKKGVVAKNTWVEFASDEPDLWLSVRKAYVDITTAEQNGGYLLKLRIYDTYNFEHIESNDGLGSKLNNLGFVAEKMGLGTPFEWEAEFTFEMQNGERKMQN